MNSISTHEQHVDDVAEAMCPDAFSANPRGLAASAQNAQRADYALDFAETLLRDHNVAPMNEAVLREALSTAEGWAKGGYSDGSKDYWAGMRDTLRIVLGITTEVPAATPDGHVDAAAITILGAQQRQTRKG